MKAFATSTNTYRSRLAALFVIAAVAFDATAQGQIFVTNRSIGTIGEYNLDGTPVNPAWSRG